MPEHLNVHCLHSVYWYTFYFKSVSEVSHEGTDKQHCVTKNECRIIFHKERYHTKRYQILKKVCCNKSLKIDT